MEIKALVASAFARDNAGGNRAGIVINHPELSTEQKLYIAGYLGYSETVYITESNDADFKLEYFTVVDEVDLCGHATIASFGTMAQLEMIKPGDYTIETKAGVLGISVSDEGLVMMQQNNPEYMEIIDSCEMKASMGDAYIAAETPVQVVSTGLKDIMLPVANTGVLGQIKPNFEVMAELSKEKGVVGVHAFAIAGTSGGVDAVCRNFAPLYGIDEESATGTSNCALAGYFYKYIEKKHEYIFDQGFELGQPSRHYVRLEYDDEIRRVFVGGYSYIVEEVSIEY